MDIPHIVGYALIFVVAPTVLFFMLRVILKKKPYEFDLVFMEPGVNRHSFIRGDSLEFEHKVNDKTFKIKPDRLYRVKPGLIGGIKMRLMSVTTRFIVVYQMGKTEPTQPEEVKVSSRILKEVHESRALDKSFRSEFSSPMDLKKILLIVGFLVIAVIVYILVSGEVVL